MELVPFVTITIKYQPGRKCFRENEDARNSRLPPESLRLLSPILLGSMEQQFISAALQAPGDAEYSGRECLQTSGTADAFPEIPYHSCQYKTFYVIVPYPKNYREMFQVLNTILAPTSFLCSTVVTPDLKKRKSPICLQSI